MSERIKEHLSALMDDELAVGEAASLVDDLVENDEARSTLARYQLISAGFRGEWADPRTLTVSDLVSRKLNDEPTVLAPKKRSSNRKWIKGAAGLAIAASVAALAVALYVPQMPGVLSQETTVAQAPQTEQVPATAVAQAPQTEQMPVMTVVSRERVPQINRQANRDRLGRYLIEHNEFATRGGASGFMPYTTFVTYDGQ